MKPYKILIVEDEKHMASFLELELMHEGYSTDKCYDGRSALEKIRSDEFDLIILDIMLPGINGVEVCRRTRLFSAVPIIMLTAKDDTFDKVMGLDSGADDYMTKPFAIEELLARIRVIKRKNSRDFADNELKIADLIINNEAHEVYLGGIPVELTKKEYDLLEYLVRNKNIVLTREKLLEAIWGYDYLGENNVVDVYIRHLRSKIDDAHEKKMISTIRGVGYMIKGDEK